MLETIVDFTKAKDIEWCQSANMEDQYMYVNYNEASYCIYSDDVPFEEVSDCFSAFII